MSSFSPIPGFILLAINEKITSHPAYIPQTVLNNLPPLWSWVVGLLHKTKINHLKGIKKSIKTNLGSKGILSSSPITLFTNDFLQRLKTNLLLSKIQITVKDNSKFLFIWLLKRVEKIQWRAMKPLPSENQTSLSKNNDPAFVFYPRSYLNLFGEIM